MTTADQFWKSFTPIGEAGILDIGGDCYKHRRPASQHGQENMITPPAAGL